MFLILEKREIVIREMLFTADGYFFYTLVANGQDMVIQSLKGLGHAILGNFSIDQVVIELTEIKK